MRLLPGYGPSGLGPDRRHGVQRGCAGRATGLQLRGELDPVTVWAHVLCGRPVQLERAAGIFSPAGGSGGSRGSRLAVEHGVQRGGLGHGQRVPGRVERPGDLGEQPLLDGCPRAGQGGAVDPYGLLQFEDDVGGLAVLRGKYLASRAWPAAESLCAGAPVSPPKSAPLYPSETNARLG